MDAVFKGHNLFVATPKSGDFPDLQFYYDVCLPGNSTILNKYDAVTMRLRDNSLNVKDCVLDFSKSIPMPKEVKPCLEPVLRTAAEPPRAAGLLENLVAMIKRNFNAPDLTGTIDIESTASVVVDKFFDSYFIKKEKYTKNIAGVMTKDSMMRWLGKQERSTIGQLANYNFVDLPAIDQYKHMIKAQPKTEIGPFNSE